MSVVFGGWKYLFKNIWFLLPFAVVPAAFFALTLNYAGIGTFVRAFFSGAARFSFLDTFRAWSLIRVDSVLGGIYSACAFVCAVFFGALMAAFVEKHMRIGKRTPSGVYAAFRSMLFPAFLLALLYLVLYEIWAVLLSAILFVISAIRIDALVYVFSALAFVLLLFALFYVVAAFYLWFPCRLATGFGVFDALLYSYRLATGVRTRLVLSFLISYGASLVVIGGACILPWYAFLLIAFVLFALLFTSFCVRMLAVYFETDKLDREDGRRGYGRGY